MIDEHGYGLISNESPGHEEVLVLPSRFYGILCVVYGYFVSHCIKDSAPFHTFEMMVFYEYKRFISNEFQQKLRKYLYCYRILFSAPPLSTTTELIIL